ncbi:MAG TPA: ATP-binding cassette domain-containing protein [Stellaceae bacterium]|nr:ATP-binding cassette domain-containing protein [Stellaceae bacterium]
MKEQRETALAVAGLNVDIGPANILRGVTLTVPARKMCGLVGRNGAGKTTFMRAVMGLIPARDGVIRFDCGDLRAVPAFERAHLGIGYLPEDRRLMPHLSAEENILLPAWITHAAEISARLRWIYELIPEVAANAKRPANQLSGGQQKMLALARALMYGTKLLLLDEPFEGLAPVVAQRFGDILLKLKETGIAVLMAESSEIHAKDLFDRVFAIERGVVAPAAVGERSTAP